MALHRPLLAGLLLLAAVPARATPPARPFPQHVPQAPGTILPDHRTQAELDADVRALYDAWKSRYLAQAGADADGRPRYRVRIARSPSAGTVSEAQGYGMLIAALMAGHDPDAQTIFDGLLQYRNDHPSSVDGRLMDWSVPASEALDPTGNDSAFDGDADIALGLLLAAAQWGNDGRFDYAAAAATAIAGIRDATIGPTSRLPMLGDWVDPDGTPYSQWTTRTSDFMLENFRAFAAATGDPVWDGVIAATQAAAARVQTVYSPTTGLLPDFLEPLGATDHRVRPASPQFLEAATDGDWAYNAVRVPWRLGLDAALHGDPVSRAQARTMSLWAEGMAGGDPARVFAVRRLDGSLRPGNAYFTTIFVATLGVAAMLDAGQQAWLNACWEAVRQSDEGYYEDTVTLLALLAMSGNWWSPAGGAPVCGDGVVGMGETCDDANTTSGDGCDANCTPTACGNGVVTAGETCDDGNTVAGDCCDAACRLVAGGTPCDDGDPCTNDDACAAGSCAGALVPATGCAAAPSGRLTLRDPSPARRTLAWTWTRGTASRDDFGDPAAGTTGYALCVYDGTGGTSRLVAGAEAAAGGTCGSRPCWTATPAGFRYRSTSPTLHGVGQIRLGAGTGTATLKVTARGGNLPPLGLPAAQQPAVTVQLKTSGGACWEARYTAPALRNDGKTFVDTPG